MLTVLLCFGLAGGGFAPAHDTGKDEPVRVYTNEDLPPPLYSGCSVIAGGSSAESEETQVALLTYATYRDRNGHNRAWWRDRVRELQRSIRKAEFARDSTYPYWKQYMIGESDEYGYSSEYPDAVETLKRLQAERLVLLEEARTAGALPGWVRDLIPE